MTSALAQADKPKLTAAGVRGKIRVFGAGGTENISQWGGTQCFLSVEPVNGPVLVVVGAKHKRGEGTLFRLAHVQKVFDREVQNGKATIQVMHGARECLVMIDTVADIQFLTSIIAVVKARTRWTEIESNILATLRSTRKRKTDEAVDAGISGRDHLLPQPGAEAGDRREADANDDDFSIDYTLPNEAQRVVQALTQQQLGVFRSVDEEGRCVVVKGMAGTGKTEWLRHLIAICPTGSLVITAASGPAARDIGGMSTGSLFGVATRDKVVDYRACLRNVKGNEGIRRIIETASVLVIDDVDRIPASAFDAFDQVARHIRNRHAEPFGGIRLFCAGDFCGTGRRAATLPIRSSVWQQLQFADHELSFSFTHVHDPPFARLLAQLRSGDDLTASDAALLEARVGLPAPAEAVRIVVTAGEAAHVNEVGIAALHQSMEASSARETVEFLASDSITHADTILDTEVLLQREQRFVVGQRVVLLCDVRAIGRRAGETGVVTGFVESHDMAEFVKVPLVHFDGALANVEIPAVETNVIRQGIVIASRAQVPLAAGYAVPLEVARRMMLDSIVLCERDAWDAREFYLALSRAQRLSGVFIDPS